MAKKVTENCFKSYIDQMEWQESNCAKCAKAVTYNCRLHRMPKYRCAVQEQIELQAAGDLTEVTERTFDAVQNQTCPFIKLKEAVTSPETDAGSEESDPDYGMFAQGKSMVADGRKIVPTHLPEPARPKKEEVVKIGDEYVLKSDVASAVKRKCEEVRDKILKGDFLTPEQRFRQQVKDDVQEMLDSFTFEESMFIAFVPLIISDIAWMYADRVVEYCVEHRVSEVKKLSMAVKDVKERYYEMLKRDLDEQHVAHIAKYATQFLTEHNLDFQIFWYRVNAGVMRETPDSPYEYMRTDALCAIYMVKLLKMHNAKMNKVIESKMGRSKSKDNPYMLTLETMMDAYLPKDFVIHDTKQIDLCLKVFENRIAQIEISKDF